MITHGNPSPEVTGSFFAEFLKLLSLDHLGLLDLPTSVGLRYGILQISQLTFSRMLLASIALLSENFA